MVEKTMYQLRCCEVWDEYWYQGSVYENESDAIAAGKTLDQEEYIWAVDPVIVHMRSVPVRIVPATGDSLPL